MNVLLSVKPVYVEKIRNGKKKYEFRRSIFKKKGIRKIYVYSTSPVGKITASFEIKKILKDTPEKIWLKCQKYAGISQKDFFAYFKDTDTAYAIEIGAVDNFLNPVDPRNVIDDFRPPQSFYYLPSNFFENIEAKQPIQGNDIELIARYRL